MCMGDGAETVAGKHPVLSLLSACTIPFMSPVLIILMLIIKQFNTEISQESGQGTLSLMNRNTLELIWDLHQTEAARICVPLRPLVLLVCNSSYTNSHIINIKSHISKCRETNSKWVVIFMLSVCKNE